MPLNTQGRIIGFLEEQKFSRVGGIKILKLTSESFQVQKQI